MTQVDPVEYELMILLHPFHEAAPVYRLNCQQPTVNVGQDVVNY